jgi:tetratricopeptide (TPR) repeat protein
MTWAVILPRLKWLLSRAGIFYVLVFFVVISLVDVDAVISRFKARDLNDARPEMGALISFNKGRISAQQVGWAPYIHYFSFVLKYMPNEAVSEMYLGVCKYYARNAKDEAWDHIRHSAEINPLIFWNIYNAGILAFERGDMPRAADYFEKALILPEDKIFNAIASSTVYRQVMASTSFYGDFRESIRAAKSDVYLFLVAASFYAGNYEKAKNIAFYSLEKIDPADKEPFFFYAGAAEMSLGQAQNAMTFFGKCIELKTKNSMVYYYAGKILKVSGDVDAANNMLRAAKSLGEKGSNVFPYADRLKLRFL